MGKEGNAVERNRRALFAVLIATIIVLAVFSSFAIHLLNRNDYEIRLPNLSEGDGLDQPGDPSGGDGELIRVEVTPETVQSVIATLARPQSYYREIRIELWGGGESAITTAQVWVDDGWVRSDVTAPGGMVQHNLVGEQTRWLWYNWDRTAVSIPADRTVSDLVQRIPTYEDVLQLPREEITDTGYENYGGMDCVFVEVAQTELDSCERYWISVANGLLVAAERIKADQPVYRMSTVSIETPAPLNSSFALPDGTVLHTMDQGED